MLAIGLDVRKHFQTQVVCVTQAVPCFKMCSFIETIPLGIFFLLDVFLNLFRQNIKKCSFSLDMDMNTFH